MKTIEMVQENLNPDLEIRRVVLSMFDGRTNLSIQVVDGQEIFQGKSIYGLLFREMYV